MAEEDGVLVRQTLDGRLEAFGRLVERYSGLVYALVLERVRRTDQVEDLVQEAFCTAFQSLRSLREPARFAPWLAQITRTTGLHWQRREGRRARAEEAGGTWLTTPVAAPDAETEQREQERAVWQTLDQLPEELRLLVVLRHLEGCSYREVARFLGLSLATVRWRLLRAEQQMARGMVHLLGEEARLAPTDRQQLQRRILAGLAASAPLALPAESAILPALGARSLLGLLKALVPGLVGLGVVGGLVAHLAGVELPGWGRGQTPEPNPQHAEASEESGMRIKLAPPPVLPGADSWEPPPPPPDPLRLAALGGVTAAALADTAPIPAGASEGVQAQVETQPGEKVRRLAPEPQDATAQSSITVVEVLRNEAMEPPAESNCADQAVPELVAFLANCRQPQGSLVWQRLTLAHALARRPDILCLTDSTILYSTVYRGSQRSTPGLGQFLRDGGIVYAEPTPTPPKMRTASLADRLIRVYDFRARIRAMMGIGADTEPWTALPADHLLARDPFELGYLLSAIRPLAYTPPLPDTSATGQGDYHTQAFLRPLGPLEVLQVQGRVVGIFSFAPLSRCWSDRQAENRDLGLQFGANLLTYASTHRPRR